MYDRIEQGKHVKKPNSIEPDTNKAKPRIHKAK